MTLRVAVQMDPIEAIDPPGDSSFALMLEAQERGLWRPRLNSAHGLLAALAGTA